MSNAMTSLSGADLRALIAAGTPGAKEELARRQAKREASGKVTVAALRSWGRTSEAEAVVAHAKAVKAAAKAAAPAKVAPVITPVVKVANAESKATAFTRTHVQVEAKSAIGHLHNRMCAVEGALATMIAQQQATNARLEAIATKLLG